MAYFGHEIVFILFVCDLMMLLVSQDYVVSSVGWLMNVELERM